MIVLFISLHHDLTTLVLQNLKATGKLLGQILRDAKAINPNAHVRGMSSDVSNYNGLGSSPAPEYDELQYHKNIAPLLEAEGFPAHFITVSTFIRPLCAVL